MSTVLSPFVSLPYGVQLAAKRDACQAYGVIDFYRLPERIRLAVYAEAVAQYRATRLRYQ
jgi:hypothetical protein